MHWTKKNQTGELESPEFSRVRTAENCQLFVMEESMIQMHAFVHLSWYEAKKIR